MTGALLDCESCPPRLRSLAVARGLFGLAEKSSAREPDIPQSQSTPRLPKPAAHRRVPLVHRHVTLPC